MANIKEIIVPKISLHYSFLDDALSAILHTILFVRAPNIVHNPKDQLCKTLKPLVYAKCGPVDVDGTVSDAVDIFRKSMQCIDEGLYHGEIVLSFYDKRDIKEYLGFVTRHENIYFEKWKISIDLTDSKYRRGEPEDDLQLYQTAYTQVTKSILHITEAVNQSTDHVPLSLYDYEIQVMECSADGAGDSESGKSIVSKLINSPAIFHSMG
jgi:hypothetical protein